MATGKPPAIEIPGQPYCYALLDGDQVFYVGKGRGRRMFQHLREAIQGGKSAKCERIRSILEDGRDVGYRILGEYNTDREALAAENLFIQEMVDLANVAGPRRPHDLVTTWQANYRRIVDLARNVMSFTDWLNQKERTPLEIRCYHEVVRDIHETERFLAKRLVAMGVEPVLCLS
jgi:hypothetical protein